MAKIAGVHQSVVVDLTGSGDFTGGTLLVSKVGNQVTISVLTALTHASNSAPGSASGVLPTWARPAGNKTVSGLITTGVGINRLIADPTGGITSAYYNTAMAARTATTSGVDATLSYITTSN